MNYEFSPEYKKSIEEDFKSRFWLGDTNTELGDHFFGGNWRYAKRMVEVLRNRNELPRNFRPQKDEDVLPIREAFEHYSKDERVGGSFIDLYRQNMLVKRRAVLETDRTEGLKSAISQAVKQSLKELTPISPPRFDPHYDRETRVLSLCLSDLHVGQLVTKEDAGGMDSYSLEVFHKRFQSLIDLLEKHTHSLRSTYNVEVLELYLLGDNTEGETIFASQGIYAEMPRIDQMEECWTAMTKLLSWAAKNFKAVRVRCVRGNHGRPGQKGVNHDRTNWDDILYHFLQTMFGNQENIKFFIEARTEHVFCIPEAPDFNFALAHGNYAQRRGLKRLREEYASLFRIPIDYLFIGHFHSPMTEDLSHGGVAINGSFVGGNRHSKDEFRCVKSPKQLLFVIDPNCGIEQRIDLFLDRRRLPRMEKNEHNVFIVKE